MNSARKAHCFLTIKTMPHLRLLKTAKDIALVDCKEPYSVKLILESKLEGRKYALQQASLLYQENNDEFLVDVSYEGKKVTIA